MSVMQPVFEPLTSLPPSIAGAGEPCVYIAPTAATSATEAASPQCTAAPGVKLASYFRVKAAVDRMITVILAVPAMPLMLLVTLAILLLDGRPVLYRQVRVGKQGKAFWIWKFRTMRTNAEAETGAVWSSQCDPRVTSLGRWLRRSHLDELPQFFNILAGDMNLIGPRPERPEFAEQLARELPNYDKRTAIRPGITGLAQLRLGYDQSVADVRKKLKLDLHYIHTATFSKDLGLLIRTVPYVAKQLAARWPAAASSGNGSKSFAARRLVRHERRLAQQQRRLVRREHRLVQQEHRLVQQGHQMIQQEHQMVQQRQAS